MNNMTAARSSRKRSHNDLEDADECLPISKRINSLHIEAQSQRLNPQDVHGSNVSPFTNFSASVAATSSPLPGGIPLQHSIPPGDAARRLDLNNDISVAMRLPTINEQSDNMQAFMNTRSAPPGQQAHFSRSLSDPYPMYSMHSSPAYPQMGPLQPPQEMAYRPVANTHQQPPVPVMHTSASDQYFRPEQCVSPPSLYVDPNFNSLPMFQTGEGGLHNLASHSSPLLPFQNTSPASSLPFLTNHSDQLSPFHHVHNQQHSPLQAIAQGQQQQPQHQDQQLSPFHCGSPGQHPPGTVSEYNQDFDFQQLPSGRYEPELGAEENPFYFSANQMLYEAHLARVQREYGFHNS